MKSKILALAIILIWSRASFAVNDLAPGTRVVPVMQHAIQAGEELQKENTIKKPVFTGPGKAELSIYPTPELYKTLGVNSAMNWTFGVIGGDREFLPAAQDLFRIEGDAPRPDKVNTYIALRERLYPATAWSVGYGQIQKIQKIGRGYKVTVLGMNLAPLKREYRTELKKVYPDLSKEAVEVLTEWRVFDSLENEETLHKLRHTRIDVIVPVDDLGKLNYSAEELNRIIASPEKVLLEIKETLKDDTPAWAKRQMNTIRFLFKHSDNMYVSPELQTF